MNGIEAAARANPALRRLDVLVGGWQMQASVAGRPMAVGHTEFAWLEGGAFLVQHSDAESPLPSAPREWVENSPFPVTAVIGLDDSADTFSMLYADARGVYRVYGMNVADGVWTMWRAAPEFHQRFTGTFSDDGNAVTGRWEHSRDGVTSWEDDFDLGYTRVS
jgi:hypothetical protein